MQTTEEETDVNEDQTEVFVDLQKYRQMLWVLSDPTCRNRNKEGMCFGKSPKHSAMERPLFLCQPQWPTKYSGSRLLTSQWSYIKSGLDCVQENESKTTSSSKPCCYDTHSSNVTHTLQPHLNSFHQQTTTDKLCRTKNYHTVLGTPSSYCLSANKESMAVPLLRSQHVLGSHPLVKLLLCQESQL